MVFYIYVDRSGEHRWTLVASNGKTIADSGEGYKSESDCLHGIALVMDTNRQTPIRRR